MAHYAFVSEEDNVVVEVIVGKNESDGSHDWESYYAGVRGLKCLRTSYNTSAGQHKGGGVPFRGNFAAIGYTYDQDLDAFIPPKPSENCVLDTNTFQWVCPSAT